MDGKPRSEPPERACVGEEAHVRDDTPAGPEQRPATPDSGFPGRPGMASTPAESPSFWKRTQPASWGLLTYHDNYDKTRQKAAVQLVKRFSLLWSYKT